MASIIDMREGLAVNLRTITGLRAVATVPDNPTPPIAIIYPQNIEYDESFQRGLQTYTFRVVVIVGRADERSAQNRLDAFVASTGANSIKLAIEKDKTLGGKVFDTRVTAMTNYGSLDISEVTYLSAEFTVILYAN
jgi:hypothetical protein